LGKRLFPNDDFEEAGLVSPKLARKRTLKAIAKDPEQSEQDDLHLFLESLE
jgi:hypothetical protein